MRWAVLFPCPQTWAQGPFTAEPGYLSHFLRVVLANTLTPSTSGTHAWRQHLGLCAHVMCVAWAGRGVVPAHYGGSVPLPNRPLPWELWEGSQLRGRWQRGRRPRNSRGPVGLISSSPHIIHLIPSICLVRGTNEETEAQRPRGEGLGQAGSGIGVESD